MIALFNLSSFDYGTVGFRVFRMPFSMIIGFSRHVFGRSTGSDDVKRHILSCTLQGFKIHRIVFLGITRYFPFIRSLAYFPGVARVFIYPSLIVICVPSLAEIAHLDGIFSIITSTLLGGTLFPRRCPGIYLSQSYGHMCTKFG
jgi:hypothetical protein